MKTPEKSINWLVLDNEYLVKYPNNGQYIELESMKVRLSKDTYDSLTNNFAVRSQYAKLTIDVIAFINVCCPDLKKDLNVASISDLDLLSTKKLIDAYIKQIMPWLTEWDVLLNAIDGEENEVEEEADKKDE